MILASRDRMCTGKVRFPTRREARAHARYARRRWHDRLQRAYLCLCCHGYHVGRALRILVDPAIDLRRSGLTYSAVSRALEARYGVGPSQLQWIFDRVHEAFSRRDA